MYVQSGVDHSFTRADTPLPAEITGVIGVVLSDVDADTNDDLLVMTDTDAISWALGTAPGASGRSLRP